MRFGQKLRRAVFLLTLPSLVWAQGTEDAISISIDKTASLLLQAFKFDNNLKKWAKDGLKIAVVYSDVAAATEAEAIAAAFIQAGSRNIQGVSVEAHTTLFENTGQLLQHVESGKANAIYAHRSMQAGLSAIQQVSRGKKVISLSGSRTFIDQGLALGVYMKKNKPRLIINDRAGKIEGLDLSPAILLVATVIK